MSKARLQGECLAGPWAGEAWFGVCPLSRVPCSGHMESRRASLPQEASVVQKWAGEGYSGDTLGTETLGGLGSTHSARSGGDNSVASAPGIPTALHTAMNTLLCTHCYAHIAVHRSTFWGLDEVWTLFPTNTKRKSTMPCKASSSRVLNQGFWSIGLIQTLVFVPQWIPGLRPPLNHRS